MSGTFFKVLLGYSFFIIAFALGFYVLLHNDTPTSPPSDYPFFDHIGLSLVKTFTMFTGELEFGDLPFEHHGTDSRYLFLLAFVFLIVVVMMNLLNGLAVSDITLLRDEAEIWAAYSDVKTIYSLVSSTINSIMIRNILYLSVLKQYNEVNY